MTKKPAGTPAAGATNIPKVPIPRTVQWAIYAIVADIVFMLAHALMARGFTPQLERVLKHSNDTAKKPKADFDVVKSLHDYRTGLLVYGVVIAVALAILAASLRRPRGASGARWALLIITVLTAQSNGPLTVVPIADYPGALSVVRTLMGVSSIAVIVLILVPSSMQYFRACKAATRPAGAPVRPGLGGLFGPRGAAAQRGAAAGQRAVDRARREAATRPAEAATNPARPKAKAKVRADAEAAAKGAELARARAKASKSRRSDG